MNTYSMEHQLFLSKNKKEKRWVLFFQFFLFLFLFSLWEILAEKGIINTFLFSSPKKMILTIYQLFVSQTLLQHIGITLLEILFSFTLSILLGLFISILLWWSPFLSKVIDPYLTILNSLPKVALGPLIIIWFGANITSIIFMSLLISLFVTIINIHTGFMNVNQNSILMAKSFGATKWQVFWYIIFPSTRETLLSTLKVNISMNLIGVIMGELLVSKKGLGYLIMYGSQVFQLDLVIASIFLLCLISYLLYIVIKKIK